MYDDQDRLYRKFNVTRANGESVDDRPTSLLGGITRHLRWPL